MRAYVVYVKELIYRSALAGARAVSHNPPGIGSRSIGGHRRGPEGVVCGPLVYLIIRRGLCGGHVDGDHLGAAISVCVGLCGADVFVYAGFLADVFRAGLWGWAQGTTIIPVDAHSDAMTPPVGFFVAGPRGSSGPEVRRCLVLVGATALMTAPGAWSTGGRRR